MGSGKEASVSEKSFNCPHCGTFASQTWFVIYRRPLPRGETPTIFKPVDIDAYEHAIKLTDDPIERSAFQRARILSEGRVVPEIMEKQLLQEGLANLWASQCYSCGAVALWRHEKLLYPEAMVGEEANPDMPADVRADYEEARTIVNASPRGAAALLRLAIQKLCVHLGEPGKHIDTDIGALVAKGLPQQIQKALDTVRVIGNDAVHPGEIDLRDDRDTVFGLLRIINIVIDNRISQQKHIEEMYALLPATKTAAIEERNARAAEKLAASQKKD